jgi:hypothetical protein
MLGLLFRFWEHSDMTRTSRLVPRFLVVIATSAAITTTIIGCGNDDGLGRRFPVSGTVTYNGNPLQKGTISFISEDPNGVGATGAIEDGSYTLSTGGNNDGARAGKYKVVVVAKEDWQAKAKADFQKARAARSNVSGTEDLDFVPKQFLSNAEAAAKSLIPAGYGNSNTTNLTAEVKEQSNTIPIKLSDAEAPPEPKDETQAKGRHR